MFTTISLTTSELNYENGIIASIEIISLGIQERGQWTVALEAQKERDIRDLKLISDPSNEITLSVEPWDVLIEWERRAEETGLTCITASESGTYVVTDDPAEVEKWEES